MSLSSLRMPLALSMVAVLTAALSLPAAGQGQGKDELWDITMKMDMAGMPMAMPHHYGYREHVLRRYY